eukprot:553772_1
MRKLAVKWASDDEFCSMSVNQIRSSYPLWTSKGVRIRYLAIETFLMENNFPNIVKLKYLNVFFTVSNLCIGQIKYGDDEDIAYFYYYKNHDHPDQYFNRVQDAKIIFSKN